MFCRKSYSTGAQNFHYILVTIIKYINDLKKLKDNVYRIEDLYFRNLERLKELSYIEGKLKGRFTTPPDMKIPNSCINNQ